MANRYSDIPTTRQGATGSVYYTNAYYPDIAPKDSDYYVITTMEDRLDLLAAQFYGNASLWWMIAASNALPGDSIYPPIGTQLRIPRDPQSILLQYKSIN